MEQHVSSTSDLTPSWVNLFRKILDRGKSIGDLCMGSHLHLSILMYQEVSDNLIKSNKDSAVTKMLNSKIG